MLPHANENATEADFPPTNLPFTGRMSVDQGCGVSSQVTGLKKLPPPDTVARLPTGWVRFTPMTAEVAPVHVIVPVIVATPVFALTKPVGSTATARVGGGAASLIEIARSPPLTPSLDQSDAWM